MVKINIYNKQKDLPLRVPSVRRAVGSLLDYLKVSCDELSFYFVTTKAIIDLHGQFFNDPTPTDCITFPIDKSYLGEIFICPKVAFNYARTKGLDPQKEVTLYIIHGILHLIGFDDLTPKERSYMRKKEKSCMRHLEQKQIEIGLR